MTEQQESILLFINKSIKTENGVPVTLGSKMSEAQLDSLGMLLLLTNTARQYNIEDSIVEKLDVISLTVVDLIELCKS